MTDELRYPIGRFVAPAMRDSERIMQAIDDIERLPERLRNAVSGLTDAQLDTPYRDGGWTVRQVVHHLADSHLNSVVRFRLALTEPSPTVKPYHENQWAELIDARTAPMEWSLQLLDGLHARWVMLLRSLGQEDWQRAFVHPEHEQPIPLWHNVALYGWHSRHHVAHIVALRQRRGWN